MILRFILAQIIFLLFGMGLRAQISYPTDYFRSPVDFPILLSGTFGELRGGHFHSGIDIKTGGVTGKRIYAVADGYVSRIKVSASGFGKTIYITHPNGFVSVYAHLNNFNRAITPYVKQKHYEMESFELDIYPEKDEMQVKKGEVIAFSGNSGGSNGPHLHFEMRLESTQTPVNPLHFGFFARDFIRPEIHWLKVIPADESAFIDGRREAKVFQIEGWGEQHRLRNHDTIKVSGPFSLAINTFDKLNDANNMNGVYSISIKADGELVYHHDLEKFDFSETRYINSLIDYEEYVENNRRYQRSEIDPNNRLSIYREVKNNGILLFNDNRYHQIEYIVKDFAGNISSLPFVIRSYQTKPDPEGSGRQDGILMRYNETNVFSDENIDVEIDGYSFYRDIYFVYKVKDMLPGTYSRVHSIHTDRVPVHTYFTVSIRPDIIPENPDKLVLVKINDKKRYVYSGGKWQSGILTARIRSFGDYTLVIDNVPPLISSVNISSGEIDPDRKTVKVRISDALSGIQSYRATLNGKWLLMDYDAKNNLLTYDIDERLLGGNNNFRLVVTDNAGNKAVFEKILVR